MRRPAIPRDRRSSRRGGVGHSIGTSAAAPLWEKPHEELEDTMNNKLMKLSPVNDATERLRRVWDELRSPAFRSILRHVSDSEASELSRAILRVVAFLDDSISNPN